ncbi:hypothetical protein HID58_080000, partial [Brassica napus]
KSSQLTASILEGGARPYQRACGDLIFKNMEKNENIQTVFNEAMLPQLKGVNFDLPPVVSEAPKIHGNYFSIPENIAMNIVFTQCHKCLSQYSGKSVEHVGGDMFDEIPQGQVVFMKWILHDWNDDQCVEILKTVRKRCQRLANNKNSLWYDVGMMCATHGGKERTTEEFKFLAMKAGFKLPYIIYGAYSYWILELYAD